MGKFLFVDTRQPAPDVIKAAVTVILKGGVVLSPTDTVHGLACDPRRPEAVRRIRDIKGRSAEKGFLLLIPGPGWVNSLAVTVPRDFQQLKPLWPGPVTFLFAAGADAPPPVVGSEQKIGMRCPQDAFLRCWLRALDRPLLSTSANRSGEAVPQSTEDLKKLFENSVDLLLLSREEIDSKASTVVDLTVSPPEIVRRGDWSGRVEKVLSRAQERGTRNEERGT